MKPIAIFYHCLIELGAPPVVLDNAVSIIREQMAALKSSGLLDAASEFIVGINGGDTSREIASLLIPSKARIVMHGLQCKNECRTIRLMEEWLPGHDDWYALYFHAKNSSHATDTGIGVPWRKCMMKLVTNWRQCVMDLELVESVGCHFMTTPQTPTGQSIWAGNFWFSRASYLRTLPSIMLRDRIKVSGIDALESRYESEVWHFNGPRLPTMRDYHGPMWNPGKISTCTP